ncbi:MAG: peptide deformylase [Candidatus Omnitrophica bacterium]|nr:peptide deformylase [Candidatus Omnitrophota bacterium]
MVAPILKEPDPLLHRKALTVPKITSEIEGLIETMIETMHAAQGVGLAANQIGSPLNILVASPNGERGGEIVLVNASLTRGRGRAKSPEGCLSLPGISSEVSRPGSVSASGLDRRGNPLTLEAEGLLAKILQHEVDHLEGHLFLHRLGFWNRRRLLRKYEALSNSLRQIKL